MNWIEIYNRFFEIINQEGENYYSGPRFIKTILQYNPHFPNYSQYIEQRRSSNKSTVRKDYFLDILMSMDEHKRVEVIKTILQDALPGNPGKVTELKAILEGSTTAPIAIIESTIWGSEELNKYLEEIDASITNGNHKRAITLSYTCLEGFFKAFIRQNIPTCQQLNELIVMSKEIQRYLKSILVTYPEEALKLISHIAHTIDRSRNGFSESHFGQEADMWLSTFIRDCVNSTIRLLLSFMH